METATEISTELGLQRLWGRRLTGSNIHEEDIAGLLEEVFPSAQVEVEPDVKSRPCSPVPPFNEDRDFCQDFTQQTYTPKCKTECFCSSEVKSFKLDGSTIGDIPAIYKIQNILKHEFPAMGIFVDPRVVPGFKYRVRPIQENGCKIKWLFNGRALELQSIGRGYSRRITFKADKGNLNDNEFYFWADSHAEGFAFEIEVVSPGDKFTVFDANRVAVGTLEVLSNQSPQEELGHRILGSGCVEKTVKVRALVKVEWYEDDNSDLIVPMTGVAVSIKSKQGCRTKLIGVTVGSHPRRGFTLRPGIDSRLRLIRVRGTSISDVPTTYTVAGLDAHQLPVIGTYVDPRIIPGFHYRVIPAAGKRRPLFGGRPLKLVSIGMGYGKRITFAPDSLNSSENFFWSDSHPDGFGFEPSAVRAGMKFNIYAGELRLGEANVFRADTPQEEKHMELVKEENGKTTIIKHIHVDLTCHVTLDTRYDKSPEPHIMRISGNTILSKPAGCSEAEILRIENIGLDSQLNILFTTQWDELVFTPV
ncbi:uncharacterized protein LOC106669406 [Cimex lectularius]|uniref:Uncharacterized protein n=1 Tax=Cimex lectularius TaxID=79782 RepID=A0A8I6RZ91_CIMLE|nr:uncharacterized protein LOC106669406 [Cimex lectularius]